MNIILKESFWLLGILILSPILLFFILSFFFRLNQSMLTILTIETIDIQLYNTYFVVARFHFLAISFIISSFLVYLIKVIIFRFNHIPSNLIFCILGLLFVLFLSIVINFFVASSGHTVYPPLSDLSESKSGDESSSFYQSIVFTINFVSVLISMGIGAILYHTILLWKS